MLDDLVKRLVESIGDALADPKSIATAAKELSISFTSDRGGFTSDYFKDRASIVPYVAAFMIPNAAKVIHCFLQMEEAGLFADRDSISVLDIGAGPGTSILAASIFFSSRYPQTEVSFAGIERSGAALLEAHDLFKSVAPSNHSFESATKGIAPGALGSIMRDHRFDIVIAANVLNELSHENAFGLCRDIVFDHLSDDGALLIIDPALRETTRPLMELRNRLISEGFAYIAGPCLHQKACPMLAANDRDWCHFYIDWECPEYLEELDRLSGMSHKHLKMAYFVFRRDPRITNHESRRWRVVSSPLVSKGKRELVLCGDNGELLKAARLDRNGSDANMDFERAKRGDVVRCDPKEKLSKDDAFSIENGAASRGK